MTDYYADSSILVKRHLAEQGSEWFRRISDAETGNTIFTAQLSIVEVVSAFNRRVRESTLTKARYRQVRDDFDMLCAHQYRLVTATPQILERAQMLIERHPLRAYDAVQLASAMIANEALTAAGAPQLVFLSADARLLDAAQNEGLQTYNPSA